MDKETDRDIPQTGNKKTRVGWKGRREKLGE